MPSSGAAVIADVVVIKRLWIVLLTCETLVVSLVAGAGLTLRFGRRFAADGRAARF